MVIALKSIGMILLYLFFFLAFGSLVTSRPAFRQIGRRTAEQEFQQENKKISLTFTIFIGMLLYYSVFQLLAVPVTLLKQPLSLLSSLWAATVAVITAVSVWLNHKKWGAAVRNLAELQTKEKLLLLVPAVITIGMAVYVALRQIYYVDAAYYVANVTTSVFTDSINRYDPYTGYPIEEFAVRYLFSNYHIQDAVICQITGIHPLVETKTIMASVVVIISNMVMWQICNLFYEDKISDKTAMFCLMTLIQVFNITYYITYTSSSFLFMRAYEGKAILANILVPGLFLLFGRIVQRPGVRVNWVMLGLFSFAGPVLSTSSTTLLPVGLSACLLPYMVCKKKLKIIIPYLVYVFPSIVIFGLYLLSTKGLFSIKAW